MFTLWFMFTIGAVIFQILLPAKSHPLPPLWTLLLKPETQINTGVYTAMAMVYYHRKATDVELSNIPAPFQKDKCPQSSEGGGL